MRSTTAYYLLLIYITVTIKPVIPVISDAFSHEFNEIEHLAKVHAKYGSHHLQKELAENPGNDKSKNQNTLRSEDQFSIHVVTQEYKCDMAINKSSVQYRCFNLHKLSPVSILYVGKPPEFHN